MSSPVDLSNISNRYSLVFQVINSGDGIRVNGVKLKDSDFFYWFLPGQRKLTFHLTVVRNFINSIRSRLRNAPQDVLVPSLKREEYLQYYDEQEKCFIFRGSYLVNEREEIGFHINFAERKLVRIEKMKITKAKRKKEREERLNQLMANNSINSETADKFRSEINSSSGNQLNSNSGLVNTSYSDGNMHSALSDFSIASTFNNNSTNLNSTSRNGRKTTHNPNAIPKSEMLKQLLIKRHAKSLSIINPTRQHVLNQKTPSQINLLTNQQDKTAEQNLRIVNSQTQNNHQATTSGTQNNQLKTNAEKNLENKELSDYESDEEYYGTNVSFNHSVPIGFKPSEYKKNPKFSTPHQTDKRKKGLPEDLIEKNLPTQAKSNLSSTFQGINLAEDMDVENNGKDTIEDDDNVENQDLQINDDELNSSQNSTNSSSKKRKLTNSTEENPKE